MKIDWLCFAFLKAYTNRKFAKSVLRTAFQVTWNFLESFQLSDFNKMQSYLRFYLGSHTRIFC